MPPSTSGYRPRYSTIPEDSPALYGVLPRRIVAYFFDILFLAIIILILKIVLWVVFVLSFGLLGFLFAGLPLVAIIYGTLLLGGPRSSTWGMRLMGLELRTIDGARPGHLLAFLQTLLFYVTVTATSGLILLVALFTQRHRTVHDILSNTVVVRTV